MPTTAIMGNFVSKSFNLVTSAKTFWQVKHHIHFISECMCHFFFLSLDNLWKIQINSFSFYMHQFSKFTVSSTFLSFFLECNYWCILSFKCSWDLYSNVLVYSWYQKSVLLLCLNFWLDFTSFILFFPFLSETSFFFTSWF